MNRRRTFATPIALAASCVVLAVGTLAAQQQEEHEGADFQRRRQAWFEDQRAYPNAQADWETIIRARAMVARSRGTLAPSVFGTATGSWLPLGPSGFFGLGYWDSGPQLDAGRVDAIALHPTTSGRMLIASPNGGIWGTSAGTWTALTDNQCTLQMSTVRFDPVNPNLVYAAASYSSGAAGCAILRSTDGGNTWSNYNGNLNFTAFNGGFIYEFYIDPASAGSTTSTTMMFTFGGSGIYRSTNSGQTWSHPFTFGQVTSIVGLPGRPGVLFAGVADYNTATSTRSGLYRSADNGTTWTQLPSGSIDFTATGRLELAVSPAQPNSVWVIAGSKSSAFQSISKWDDVTSALSPVAASGIDLSAGGRTHFGGQATYDLDIAVDPTDAQRIYIAGVRAFKSKDGGATFAPMATEIHCDWHAIVIDPRNPQQLYAGTDGGVFSSPDGGNTWISRNAGLVISMYYPGIAQHPTDVNVVLGGLQDNGTLLANGTSFYNSLRPGGDGGYTAINYQTPTTIWTTCQWSSSGPCIQKRAQVGNALTYPIVSNGIIATDRAAFVPPLVMDPVTPTTLYFATMRLYRTTNDGALWTAISPDLTKGTGYISSVAVAPSDPLTIYVGTNDGNVQVTRDGGTTWTVSTAGLANRYITNFAIDRLDPTRGLITHSGNSATHVYLTTNAGQTWTSVTGSLPNMPVNAVVMIDDGPNHFFIGTDAGAFETTDGGLTWSSSPAGMPNVIVHDLNYNPTTKQLVAATFGRGLFSYSLANPAAVLRGDVNKDGAVNAFDALLIQQALLGLPLPSGLASLPRGDSNCNNRLDAADVLAVLRAAVGLTTAGACVGTVR
jgi:photosystem II stability/assembly factor-like uncharacterized protein